MASIIVPAYNEASVIERSLRAILFQAEPEDEIIVCANGCNDATEEIAKTFSPRVVVLVSEYGSKTNALNIGEAVAKSFPRIYIDADVELMPGCLDRLKVQLSSGRYLAAAPEPIVDLSRSSWPVRAYFATWLSLPFCQQGMAGAGVYALTEKGRSRFGHFPNLIADDGYVRALFKEHERCKVSRAQVRVRPPTKLKMLLKVKTRSRMGQMQLAQRHPELRKNEQKKLSNGIGFVFMHPFRWPAAAVYLAVTLITRVAGRRKLRTLASYTWDTDLSSRTESICKD